MATHKEYRIMYQDNQGNEWWDFTGDGEIFYYLEDCERFVENARKNFPTMFEDCKEMRYEVREISDWEPVK